jgi:hypothetical protein
VIDVLSLSDVSSSAVREHGNIFVIVPIADKERVKQMSEGPGVEVRPVLKFEVRRARRFGVPHSLLRLQCMHSVRVATKLGTR